MDRQPPGPIRIGPMTDATVEAVARLEEECFSTPWSLDSLIEELSNPLAVFLTASMGDEIVGYAGMHHIMDEGYITNIAVAESHRGFGVATALMDAFLAYGLEHRLELLTLEVRPSNKAALSLYEGYGFTEEGRRRDYYRNPQEDALVLTLRHFGKRPRLKRMLMV